MILPPAPARPRIEAQEHGDQPGRGVAAAFDRLQGWLAEKQENDV